MNSMVEFTMWYEALIFFLIFATIVLVPCVLCALLGLKMIDRLSMYPSKTPVISLKIFIPLLLIEAATFGCFVAFYNVFAQ